MKVGERVKVTAEIEGWGGLVGQVGTVVHPQQDMHGFAWRVRLDLGPSLLFNDGELDAEAEG